MSSSSDADIMEHRDTFGPSDEFIKSICGNCKCSEINEDDCKKTVIEEARSLASCTYEEHTKWGEKASLLFNIKHFICHLYGPNFCTHL